LVSRSTQLRKSERPAAGFPTSVLDFRAAMQHILFAAAKKHFLAEMRNIRLSSATNALGREKRYD
jgi:hypothetical protein